MQKPLYYAALVACAIAVVMAFAALEGRPSVVANPDLRPESAIAMAIVAYVLLRASDSRPT